MDSEITWNFLIPRIERPSKFMQLCGYYGFKNGANPSANPERCTAKILIGSAFQLFGKEGCDKSDKFAHFNPICITMNRT